MVTKEDSNKTPARTTFDEIDERFANQSVSAVVKYIDSLRLPLTVIQSKQPYVPEKPKSEQTALYQNSDVFLDQGNGRVSKGLRGLELLSRLCKGVPSQNLFLFSNVIYSSNPDAVKNAGRDELIDIVVANLGLTVIANNAVPVAPTLVREFRNACYQIGYQVRSGTFHKESVEFQMIRYGKKLVVAAARGTDFVPGKTTVDILQPTQSPTPTMTVTPTMSVTPTPSVTGTPTITSTATPTPTASASATPTVTSTATPTPTASVSATPAVTSTVTPTVTCTATPAVTSTVTPTVTCTATPAVTSTVTPTVTASASTTPNVTATPTPTVSVSATPVVTSTVTPTITASITPTVSVSATPSVTMTVTPSPTTTVSATPSVTNTVTPTVSVSATPNVTTTPTATVTPTVSVSSTPSVSVTPTVTVTTTPASSATPTVTATVTPTGTVPASPAATVTPTVSVTTTPVGTLPATPTPTPTITVSVSVSGPPVSVTPTPTITMSPTPTPTITPSITQIITTLDEEIMDDAPWAYYKLNDPVGSTMAMDSSGNNRHLTTLSANPPIFGVDELIEGLGTATSFNGIDQYITGVIPGTNTTFHDYKDFTIEMVIKPGNAGSISNTFFHVGNYGVSESVGFWNGRSTSEEFTGGAFAGTFITVTSPAGSSLDDETYIVTIVRSQLTSSLIIYVNGIFMGIIQSPVLRVRDNNQITIAAAAQYSGFVNYGNATIQHLALYNRELPVNRIEAHAKSCGLFGTTFSFPATSQPTPTPTPTPTGSSVSGT